MAYFDTITSRTQEFEALAKDLRKQEARIKVKVESLNKLIASRKETLDALARQYNATVAKIGEALGEELRELEQYENAQDGEWFETEESDDLSERKGLLETIPMDCIEFPAIPEIEVPEMNTASEMIYL